MASLIRKSKQVLKAAYFTWKKSRKYTSAKDYEEVRAQLNAFQQAILENKTDKLLLLLPQVKSLLKDKIQLPFWLKARDFTFGLILAIIAAFGLIRPMWFELYQIPSGSMRPTLKEMDRLTVSKTQYGINIPLTVGHFLFEPEQVKRNGIVIFTGEGMDISGGMTDYFYLFKGYKQYIKRLIGKPLDTLYFYGGKIYGIDAFDQSITKDLNPSILEKIDHVPFLNFEGVIKPKGRNSQNILTPVVFQQNGLSVLRMQAYGNAVKSEILYNNTQPIEDYYQLFGFGHYGICRLVKKDRYYLEIQHHPSIKGAKIQQDLYGRLIPSLNLHKSYLPMDDEKLKKIYESLYTARFTVKNGFVKRSSQNNPPLDETSSHVYPKINGIPDGTYEFEQGKAYQIYTQGISVKLPDSHPLNQFSVEKAVAFFNFGIEFDLAYSPDSPYKLFPSRYVYYRFGDLYVMGNKIFDQNENVLKEFVQDEINRQQKSSDFRPFIDEVPPMKDFDIDPAYIKQYGLKIPEKSYYVLGDNHAMSADSRRFGFVPVTNLRGVPDLLFWPFGSRFGKPLQPNYPLFTTSRIIIWILGLIAFIVYKLIQKKRGLFPYNFKDSQDE
jgi:signal peptidase I